MPPTPGLKVVNTGTGDGIVGATTDPMGFGVHGIRTSTGAPFAYWIPAAVYGESTGSISGVVGWSERWNGVDGVGHFCGVAGVSNYFGIHSYTLLSGTGVNGCGATGVYGLGTATDPGARLTGVLGQADPEGAVGVEGDSESGVGVSGSSRTGVGVHASTDTRDPDRAGLALLTDGDALIRGGLYVAPGNPKSALVKARDGSHRALYCVESPECWFEDFGRARLVRGRGRVRLDPTFASVVRTGDYHVFLSPEGLSHGLYVSRRTANGFEVREQHRGTSTVSFSYRIIARRKDVKAPRFKRVNLSRFAKLPRAPKGMPVRTTRPLTVSVRQGRPNLGRLLKSASGRKLSAGRRR